MWKILVRDGDGEFRLEAAPSEKTLALAREAAQCLVPCYRDVLLRRHDGQEYEIRG